MASTSAVDRLQDLGLIPTTYRHHQRLVLPGDPLVLPNAVLKWYDVAHVDARVADDLRDRSRSSTEAAVERGEIPLDYGLGFVVLHHTTALDYLIVGAWRSNQELWTTHATRDATGNGPFQVVRPGVDASTLCVWEMAPVWHEREVWVRYLDSPREHADRRAWLGDVLRGEV